MSQSLGVERVPAKSDTSDVIQCASTVCQVLSDCEFLQPYGHQVRQGTVPRCLLVTQLEERNFVSTPHSEVNNQLVAMETQ